MKQRPHLFLLLSALLVLAGIGLYLVPKPVEELPDRILLPNAGGKTIFTHAAHVKYEGVTCQDCHHELNIPERELSDEDKKKPDVVFRCGECHGATENPTFIEKHKRRYAKNDGGKTCLACHHTDSIEPRADGKELTRDDIMKQPLTSCKDCHGDNTLGRMDSFHKSCFDCHDSLQKGPGSKAPCQQCHLP